MRLVSWLEDRFRRRPSPDVALATHERAVLNFYRQAMWSPFVVTPVALVVGSFAASLGLDVFSGVVLLLAATTAAGLIPYAIYLVVMRMCWPPETEHDFRRAALMAPIGSGVILTLIVFTLILAGGEVPPSLRELRGEAAFFTNAALAVGYLYVLFVELGVRRLKRGHAASADRLEPSPTDGNA